MAARLLADADARRCAAASSATTPGRPGLLGLVAGRLADDACAPGGRGGARRRGGPRLRARAGRLPRGGRARGVRGPPDQARRPRGGRRLQPPAPTRGQPFVAAFAALAAAVPAAGPAVEVQRPGRQLVDLVLPARYLGLGPGGRARPPGPVRSGARRAGPRRDRHARRRCAPRRRRARQHVVVPACVRGIETFDAIAFGMDAGTVAAGARGRRSTWSARWSATTFGGMPRLRLRVLDYAMPAPARCSPVARLPDRAGPGRMTRPLRAAPRATRAFGAPLCLGIDPHPDQLPAGAAARRRRRRGVRARR